ncbi:MAG: galactokinase [Anaerolineales bacterium]|nr:galactokinase [Anaerolineales bacterium]
MVTGIREQVITAFRDQYESFPEILVRAPGRVNLIGEHTDYNNGFALPMAIDRAIWIALRPRNNRRIKLRSLDFPQHTEFSLDQIEATTGWEAYIRGAAWALQESGYSLQGWEGVLGSDIPIASGLSSSAAVEIAVLRTFQALGGWEWDGIEAARIAKKLENEWLGLKSGIMDQLISACGIANYALLIDFESIDFELVPVPEEFRIVVMNTAVPRSLVDSAYNQRVEECQQACDFFNVHSLRELSWDEFSQNEKKLPVRVNKRVRHVLSENQRTLQAAAALRFGNVKLLGQLMNQSHQSLRDDYQVSCKELDGVVSLALNHEGCLGARMTGAGFGGSAIALVEKSQAEVIAKAVAQEYREIFNLNPVVFVSSAADGADWEKL